MVVSRGKRVAHLVLERIVTAFFKLVLGIGHIGVQIAGAGVRARVIEAVSGGEAHVLRKVFTLVGDRLADIAHTQKRRPITAIAAIGCTLQHVPLISARTCPRVPIHVDVLVIVGGFELFGPIGRPCLG